VTLARSARHLLVPSAARARPNPVRLDDGVLERSRAHFADHCATCHGNDGHGETPYGRSLYPRAPDLTAPGTQGLSDGELFYLIENGVRFSGMPAFATAMPEGERESWELVHFIRHLPRISREELSAMAQLNPVSRSELERELQIEKFLAGEDAVPPTAHEH
jgi:mono/diheme cytochrome c family protein